RDRPCRHCRGHHRRDLPCNWCARARIADYDRKTDLKDIYDILREATRRPGERFALATLVRAEGSSYRRPGARMLICKDGTTAGSLSGGCLEEEIAFRAREVLETGGAVLMSFDTRKRFGCHGKI